ncbi:MAG: type II secretion system protein J [Pyrinomonadaceae bacterium]
MQPKHKITLARNEQGFSLMELMIAMTVTLALMGMASTLIAGALRMRSRENQKSDALADAQRAMNIMSREIADAGFNLNTNGLVAAESGANRIRIRSNLNKYDYAVSDSSRNNVTDPGEDVSYFINLAANTKYLARHDQYGTGNTVLANRLDSFNIHYFASKVTYTADPAASDISNASAAEVSPDQAKYIVIAVSVILNQVGKPGSPGYQPAYTVLLCSDVTLRNSNLTTY